MPQIPEHGKWYHLTGCAAELFPESLSGGRWTSPLEFPVEFVLS